MKIVDMDALWKGIEELIGNIDVYLPVNFINEFAENYIVDVVPKWVLCEERLPEKEQLVLCQSKSGITNVLRLNPNGFWESHYPQVNYKLSFVIAWMPLPKPYGGEREDDEVHKNG